MKDEKVFEVSTEVARMSKTIADMLDTLRDDENDENRNNDDEYV